MATIAQLEKKVGTLETKNEKLTNDLKEAKLKAKDDVKAAKEEAAEKTEKVRTTLKETQDENKALQKENSKLKEDLAKAEAKSVMTPEEEEAYRGELRLEIMEEMAAQMAEEEEEEQAPAPPKKFIPKPFIVEDGNRYEFVNNKNSVNGAYGEKQAQALVNIFKAQRLTAITVQIPKAQRQGDEPYTFLYKGNMRPVQTAVPVTASEEETEE